MPITSLENASIFKAAGILIPLKSEKGSADTSHNLAAILGPGDYDDLSFISDEAESYYNGELDGFVPVQLGKINGETFEIYVHEDDLGDIPSDLFALDDEHTTHGGEAPIFNRDRFHGSHDHDIDDIDPADTLPASQRTRRIDALHVHESRERRLKSLVHKIHQLEETGNKLVQQASEDRTAGKHLLNGRTESDLVDQAHAIVDKADEIADAKESHAEDLFGQAKKLKRLGGQKNRARARFKIELANFLKDSASTIRDKAYNKADNLRADATAVGNAMDRLGLDDDASKRELKHAGTHLLDHANEKEEAGTAMLERAEKGRKLIKKLLDGVRYKLHHLRRGPLNDINLYA